MKRRWRSMRMMTMTPSEEALYKIKTSTGKHSKMDISSKTSMKREGKGREKGDSGREGGRGRKQGDKEVDGWRNTS